MIRCDALIVGGGPAGSTCARVLRLAGWRVIVADRARFPRDKVCAGWLTPGVFQSLDLAPAEYKATGLTLQEITAFRTGLVGGHLVETRYSDVVSYAIRRCEFDDFLLRRAQVCVREGMQVANLHRKGDTWIVNEEIQAPIVIGAGGHFCPVARQMRVTADTAQPVVAKEAEFRLDGLEPAAASEAPELFFCRDLDGYGWCVRKGDYLNVGIGRRSSRNFASHVRAFMEFLADSHRVSAAAQLKWRGHAYGAMGIGSRPVVADGILLVGDAAGLAYPESGEGIRPAIDSGRLAGEVLIQANGRHAVDDLKPYAETLRRLHPPVVSSPGFASAVRTSLGRLLLQWPPFARHVVLDRWFVRV